MAKYVYPAVFIEEDGLYNVSFPDISGCATCGNDLAHAMEMAADSLALMLCEMEDCREMIPEPTPLKKVSAKGKAFVSYVVADTLEYRKKNNNKAVKRTVSLPQWLDIIATAQNINFSQTLQNALKAELHIL